MTTGYIYKITNKINDKIYIGQTARDIDSRYYEHKKCAENTNTNQPLYNAMRKYGVEAFKVELVEECDESMLNDREIYYIDKYNSYKNGYNATLGGDGRPTTDYDQLAKDFMSAGQSMATYAAENGIKDTTIRHALRATNQLDEYKEIHPEYNTRFNTVAVNMLDKKTGKLIETFESISKALKFLDKDKDKGHIKAVCTGNRQTAYGYKWQYA